MTSGLPMKYDMTGKRYGRVKALKRVENMGKHIAWACRCDCGTTWVVRGQE